MNTPEGIFSQLKDFSEDLRDISLNGSTLATAKKVRPGVHPSQSDFPDTPIPSPQVDNTHNSSLGILGNSGLGSFSIGDTTTNSLIFPSISSGSSFPPKKSVAFHAEQLDVSETEIDGGPLEDEEPEIKFSNDDFKELDAAYTPSASDTEPDNDQPTRSFAPPNPLVDLGLVASYTSSSFASQLAPQVQSSSDELAKPLESSQPVQDHFVKPLPPITAPTPRSLSRPRPLISTPQQGLPQNLLEPAFNQSDASSIVDGTPQLPPRVPIKRGPAFDSLIQTFQSSMANSPFMNSSADNSDFPWEKVLQGEPTKANGSISGPARDLSQLLKPKEPMDMSGYSDAPFSNMSHLLKPTQGDVSLASEAGFRDMSHLLRPKEVDQCDMSHLLRPKDVDITRSVDITNIGDPLDPSFCSGKMSSRSTSIGGGDNTGNTRDENFSDFTKPASFQGSFMSQYSNQGKFGDVSTTSSVRSAQIIDEKDESVFHSGSFPLGSSFKNAAANPFDLGASFKNAAVNPFDFGDIEPQVFQGNYSGEFPIATNFETPIENPFGMGDNVQHEGCQQQGLLFGDEEFQYGSQDKNMKAFFDKEEAENLIEHKFIEDEQMEDVPNQSTASAFSGISDKSIFLKNSNLWAGDTSNVNLAALRQESERKMTRCEYFRHNSSRLGSLEDSVLETERPELGFVHKIRSPVRKPMALLSDSQLDDSAPRGEVVFKSPPPAPPSYDCSDATRSAPSSTDTTFSVPSGDSTKTVVSLMENTGTLKAADLVSRLEAFVRSNANSSRVSSNPETSRNDTDHAGDGDGAPVGGGFNLSTASATSHASEDINVSTISKILSEASISQDPQQFVNLILNCVKRKVAESPNTSVASSAGQPGVNLGEIIAGLSDSFSSVNQSVSNNESFRTFQVEGSPGRDTQSPSAASLRSATSSSIDTPASLRSAIDSPSSLRSGTPSAADTPSSASSSRVGTDTPILSNKSQPITDTPTSHGEPRKLSMYTSGKKLSSSKLTPRQSELARMRLPGPGNSFQKRLSGGITPLPAKGQIKPFGNTRSVPVASAKPFKRTVEEPPSMGSPQLSASRRNGPNISSRSETTSSDEVPNKVAKSSSGSINTTRQRRPSGARHSSPIKEVRPAKTVTIQAAPASIIHASRDLSSLFEDHTPTIGMGSSKQLHTSTPYCQPDMNLSMVIMNQLTQNKSLTPVLNPDISLNPEYLDVSTISPDLYTTLKVATHVTPKAPFNEEVNIPAVRRSVKVGLPDDYTHQENLLSHVNNNINVSVIHNLEEPTNVILKVIKVWIGSVLVPVEYWPNVLKMEPEKFLNILPETRSIPIQVCPLRTGAFSLNLGLALSDGTSTSGLVRFRAEEPNVQILTENGSQVDFGTMPEDCRSSVSLQVVNSGACSVPITLKINRLKHQGLFYFLDETEKEVDTVSFSIPGVSADSKEGEGLAKEVAVWAKTCQINANEPQVLQNSIGVFLGEDDSGVALGTIETMVRAGKAKLRTKKSLEPVVFSSLPGGKCHKKIPLMNSGNIPLSLEVSFDNDNEGCFVCEKCVRILPNAERILDVTFNCPKSAAADSRSSTMFLKVVPGGLHHMISIEIDVLSRSQENYKENSGPALSFGTLKKPLESTSPLRERNEKEPAIQHKLPEKFPVESDRSLVNWFSVAIGASEEQILTLRNTLSEPIALTVIIRDSSSFKLISAAGQALISELVLAPHATKDVKMAFSPSSLGIHRGKLVLKPQGRSISGKTFKASISLVGMVGSSSVALSGVEKKQEKGCSIFLGQVEEGQEVCRTIVVTNNGNGAAFVKFMCVEELEGVVVPGEGGVNASPNGFILETGQARKVTLNLPSVSLSDNNASGISTIATLAMFSGPELCRQVLKRARRLPGAARNCSNPALMGVNFDCVFSGEESLNPAEIYTGHLTNLDVKHLYNKAVKQFISLTALANAKPTNFDALCIEETLSESRLDGRMSIAPHSPPTRGEDVLTSQLIISPSQVVFHGGSDGLLTLINRGTTSVHWDMSWPGGNLSVTPPAGELCGGGQAIIVITAESRATLAGWTGNIQVYSDNNVSSVEVVVKPAKQVKALQVSVSPSNLDMGLAVVGQTVSGMFKVTNPSNELIQWKAALEPGMFSLPQTTGLLNPAQSVALAATFCPTSAGAQAHNILVNTYIFKGGSTGKETGSPVLLSISGCGVSVPEATKTLAPPSVRQSTEPPASASMASSWKGAATLPRPRDLNKGKIPARRGSISLEKERIEFPVTRVGETSVAKIKIKNRRMEDQAVEILPLDSDKPFKTVHTVIEVKSQCYCTLPVQFKPLQSGPFSTKINMRAGGRVLTADLVGNAR